MEARNSHIEVRWVYILKKNSERLSGLEAEEKGYLSNPNLLHALIYDHVNKGNIRETYFISVLQQTHELSMPKSGDFWVDNAFLFEVGGKNKDTTQIKHKENSYRVLDDLERGFNKKIPLWLFGFLY